jgi:hypothetical protein
MAIEWVLIWLGPFKRKSGHRHTQREKTVISKAMRGLSRNSCADTLLSRTPEL